MAAPPHLLHVFPSFALGGAQMRLVAVANHFGPALRHTIVSLDKDIAAAARLAADVPTEVLTVPLARHDTPGSVRHCRRLLAAWRPDVLVTHNWGTIEWAMANLLVRRRHVHIEDGFGEEERTHQLARRVWTRRLVLRRATVVLPSRTLERIATGIWRLPRRRVRYVPNGIDLARFAPAAGAAAPRSGDVPVIGTVAGLRKEKNVGRLIDAFALLRGKRAARLVIVGDGPERGALEQQAAARGIAADVTFTGATADTPGAYRGFDLFALSSDTEQMPLSLLEAMGCALPVAATDVGDVADMLSEANRSFVVPCDAGALAEALAALLDDPERARTLGAANRARAEREFDQQTMFAAYAALFGAAASSGASQ